MLKEQRETIFKKLVAISGDVAEENLGISPSDREILINNVNLIIHSAATLDFHEPLRPTVVTNLLGTRRVTQLAKEVRHLHSFVHVSSAYVNSYLVECDEILYPAPANAESVIEMVTSLNDEELQAKQASLLGEHPNTYTFTKHLAEHEVAKCADKFPCGIVRPSMSRFQFYYSLINIRRALLRVQINMVIEYMCLYSCMYVCSCRCCCHSLPR